MPDGSLDATFDADGTATIDFGSTRRHRRRRGAPAGRQDRRRRLHAGLRGRRRGAPQRQRIPGPRRSASAGRRPSTSASPRSATRSRCRRTGGSSSPARRRAATTSLWRACWADDRWTTPGSPTAWRRSRRCSSSPTRTPTRPRAYRRAAETIRGAPVPVAELVRVRAGARAARDRPGDRGAAARARRDRRDRRARGARARALARARRPRPLPRARREALGRDRAGARRADAPTSCARRRRPGGCGPCRGSGRRREAQLLEALAREAEPRPQRGLLLNRAWELVGGIAAALGGEAAGDVRRWRDSCEHLAVVCAAPDPGAGAGALRRAAPDRRGGRAGRAARGRRDGRGRADRARRRRAGALRDRPRARDGLARRTSRRSSRCRTRPTRRPSTARSASRGARRSCARSRSAASRRRSSSRPTSAATSTATRRGRTDARASRRWAAPRASAATTTSRSATTRRPSAPSAASAPTTSAARPRRSRRRTRLLAPFRVLRGIECDILPDGRLDLPDDVLAELDWVQASVHGGQRMPRREMTERVEEALRNPHVRCLSHPTGRLIGRRPENALDLERVFEVALEEGVALEVNGLARPARPQRRARPRRDPRRRADRLLDRRALGRAGSGTWRSRSGPRAAAGRRPRTSSTPARCSRSSTAEPDQVTRRRRASRPIRPGADARPSPSPTANLVAR